MKWVNKTLILIIGLMAPATNIFAQDETYRMELGGAIGGSFYMGDANYSTPFKNTGVAGGVMARWLLNPRMAIKGNLMAGRISGDTKSAESAFPGTENVSFSTTVFDLGAQYEYNFLGYNSQEGYLGNNRFTPYILGGVGMTYASPPADDVFTLNFPVGAGVKYKIAHRINIGCELTMRFSLSDKLDATSKDGLNLSDPFRIKGKGFKNKDSYAFAVFFVTYDLFPLCRGCNRD